jgi:hypothetical protein
MSHIYTVASIVCSLCVSLISRAPAQYTNVRISTPGSTTPEEVSIAINPTNPLNLVAGANIRYYFYTLDGGVTWSQGQLPAGTWGDPCVAFDAGGRLFYGHLSSLPAPATWIDRLTIHRSSNGGRSWFDSVTVGLNGTKAQDKEWLVADLTNSPYRNNLYMAWTEFDVYGSKNATDSSRVLFSRSTDNGTTWSSPLRISNQGGDCVDDDNTVEGAVPAIGPNGEVYVSWAGPRGIEFDKSLDGGKTFGNDVVVTDLPGGWAFDIPGISRCNGLPITACDISNSPFRGTIYINWSDQRNGATNTDIFLIKSTNGGQSWSTVRRVNDDNSNRHQFFTWMTIDQSSGYLYFVFYDRRNYVDSTTDVFCARSKDGGETFTNFKVSQTSFLPRSNVFFGDYTNIAAQGGKVYPMWMRLDGTALSVWTAKIDEPATDAEAARGMHREDFILQQNFPNPFNPSTTIGFRVPYRCYANLCVFDVLGRNVARLLDGEISAGEQKVHFYADNLAGGIYFYRLQAGDFVDRKKLILMK